MVRQDIIAAMAEKTGKSEYEAKEMLEAMIDIMTESLQNGEEVILRGFGAFKVKMRAPRTVCNISTHEHYKIGCRKRVTFEPGTDLKKID